MNHLAAIIDPNMEKKLVLKYFVVIIILRGGVEVT